MELPSLLNNVAISSFSSFLVAAGFRLGIVPFPFLQMNFFPWSLEQRPIGMMSFSNKCMDGSFFVQRESSSMNFSTWFIAFYSKLWINYEAILLTVIKCTLKLQDIYKKKESKQNKKKYILIMNMKLTKLLQCSECLVVIFQRASYSSLIK